MKRCVTKMELAVIGEGGHSKVVRDIIRSKKNYTIKAVLDDKYGELILSNGVYFGPISSAHLLVKRLEHIKFVVAIGQNDIRKSIVTRLGLPNDSFISLIHKSAVISSSAIIGQGSIIMANAIINADAKVGRHVIINTGAIVEHDNTIGDYVHVAPKGTLTGSVCVKEGTMIGAGATVIPGKNIDEWAIIGAGATVISDIPSHSTAVGTPARIITKHMFA